MNQERDGERDATAAQGPDEPARQSAGPQAGATGARHAILARRAKFVTMALASAGLAVASQGCKDPEASVCLSMEEVPTASSTGARPDICLSAEVCLEAPMVRDAGSAPTGSPPGTPPTGSAAADAPNEVDGGPTEPRVCLRIRPPDLPQPCLSKPAPRPCLTRPPDKPAPTS